MGQVGDPDIYGTSEAIASLEIRCSQKKSTSPGTAYGRSKNVNVAGALGQPGMEAPAVLYQSGKGGLSKFETTNFFG